MSAFRFGLGRVLGVRRVEEDIARAEWLDAERIANAAEAEANILKASLERARADLALRQSSAQLHPADVLLTQALVDRLREQWVLRTIHASRARRESERLRLLMAERRVRVRGLERLESKERQSWRLENEVRANAELDERASLSGNVATESDERAHSGTWNQP